MPVVPILKSRHHFLPIAGFLILAGTGMLPAQQTASPPGFILTGSISAISNDNLIIGTETRSPMKPISAQFLTYSVTAGVNMALAVSHRLAAAYSFYVENQPQASFLRRNDHTLSLDVKGQAGNSFGYVVNGAYRLYHFKELGSLNFNQTHLHGAVYYQLPFGLMLEGGYFYLNKHFTEDDNNITGYSLVTSTQQKFEARAKKWLGKRFRLSLRYSAGNLHYEPTSSTYLNHISGLSPEQERIDHFFAVQPELLILLWGNRVLFNLGYQAERNSSNSDYYEYSGLKALADIVIAPHPKHTFTVETNFGVYDYSLRQFDVRYKNTKEDFRTTVFVTYQWEVSGLLNLQINYNFMKNDSNDSFDYNPLTSRTYSSFTQNFFRASLEVQFGQFF